MKGEFRNSALLLVACLGLWAWIGFRSGIEDLDDPSGPTLVSHLDRGDIEAVEVTVKGSGYRLRRDRAEPGAKPAEGWTLEVGGARHEADPGSVDSLLLRLEEFPVQRTVEAAPADPAAYGLAGSEDRVAWSSPRARRPEEREIRLVLGGKSPIASQRFVRREEGGPVFIANTWDLDLLQKQPDFFRDKRILRRTETEKVERIRLDRSGSGGDRLLLVRIGSGVGARWTVARSATGGADALAGAVPAESSEVRLLVSDLRALRVQDFASSETSGTTSFPVLATVDFGSEGGGSETLEIGPEDPGRANRTRVRTAGREWVTVASDLLRRATAGFEDYRERRFLASDLEGATQLSVRLASGLARTVVLRDEEWTGSEDRSPATTPVRRLLDKLGGARAEGWIEDGTGSGSLGLATPEAVLGLVAGERRCRWSIGAPSGPGTLYFQRDGGGTIYRVTGGDLLHRLRTLADDPGADASSRDAHRHPEDEPEYGPAPAPDAHGHAGHAGHAGHGH